MKSDYGFLDTSILLYQVASEQVVFFYILTFFVPKSVDYDSSVTLSTCTVKALL